MGRALLAIAQVDGIHPAETALIEQFYAEVLRDLPPEHGERATAITPAELAAALPREDLRSLFLKTAMLLAWADDSVSAAEWAMIEGFATALGMDGEMLGAVDTDVRAWLADGYRRQG